jgi:hypothetical protein
MVGIEIASSRAAVADVDHGRGGLRVRRFGWIDGATSADDLADRLAALRRKRRFARQARVVAWGPSGAAVALVETVRRAGFEIDRRLSTGEALTAVAAARRTHDQGKTSAYLALHADGGHLAIVSDGHLLFERPLAFSYGQEPPVVRVRLLRRYTLLAGLAADLSHAFDIVRRGHGLAVKQIVTCGSLPDLRSLTLPLAEEFDLEVETLDSPEGIDLDRLPSPADGFRERVAALRFAIAAAQSGLGERKPARRWAAVVSLGVVLMTAAVIGVIATRREGDPRVPRTPRLQVDPRTPRRQADPPATLPLPSGAIPTTGRQVAPPAAPPAAPVKNPRAGRLDRSRPPPPADAAPDIVVTSILYSSGRRLAVVNGAIVGAGDRVGRYVVSEIADDGVLLRDAAGGVRRVPLAGAKGPF